ncbi:MAG: hypothetical protein AB7O38_04540 [Pirellulaceae bacterium]
MARFLATILMAVAVGLCGCEGDYQGQPGQPPVEVHGTPDLNPATDHDVDVHPPDIDVDAKPRPGGLPDVQVDAFKTPDPDTKANQP